MVPASVSGQERNLVVSAPHLSVAAHVCDKGEGRILKQVGGREREKVQATLSMIEACLVKYFTQAACCPFT